MGFGWTKKLMSAFSGSAATGSAFERDHERLFQAARDGDLATIDELTTRHAHDFAGWKCKEGSPLYVAQKNGRLDAFKLLIDRGCDVNENYGNNLRPLLTALLKKQNDFFEYLLEKGAEISDSGQIRVGFEGRTYHATPLHIAIKRGDQALVVNLLERGADPSVTARPDGYMYQNSTDYAERKKQFVLRDLTKRAQIIRQEYLARTAAAAAASPPASPAPAPAPAQTGNIPVLNPIQLKKAPGAATGS